MDARWIARAALVALALALACGGGDGRANPPDGSLPPTDSALPGPDLDGPRVDLAVTPVDGAALDGPVALATWPGAATVTTVSAQSGFGANVSGLVYEPGSATVPDVLWAVQNEPSKLYRLTFDGAIFTQVTGDGWVTGKLLRYPGGGGSPDSEGLTRTEWTAAEIYVAAERDNDKKDVSRQSILRYDLSGTKGVADATHEWVLTADLPAADQNCGLEGIAWLPDGELVARGFLDESTGAPYLPARYPDHGSGIFLVGYDATGMIYGYVLDHQRSTFTRVATFASGQSRSVDLTFDRETGTLWSLCDSKCNGRMTVFEIDADPASPTAGRFVQRATVAPPRALTNMNNEGFAMAPLATCVGEQRPFFWADDEESGGYALRRGTITCGRFY